MILETFWCSDANGWVTGKASAVLRSAAPAIAKVHLWGCSHSVTWSNFVKAWSSTSSSSSNYSSISSKRNGSSSDNIICGVENRQMMARHCMAPNKMLIAATSHLTSSTQLQISALSWWNLMIFLHPIQCHLKQVIICIHFVSTKNYMYNIHIYHICTYIHTWTYSVQHSQA